MRTRARDGRAWGGGRRARTAIRGRGATATAGQADVRRRAVRGPCRPGDGAPWRLARYDPTAPMLCDALRPGDVVTERAMPPLPKATLSLF